MILNTAIERTRSPENRRQVFGAGGGAQDLRLAASTDGRTLPISWIRVKKFVTTTAFATCQAQVHGFHPQATLEEGLRVTLDSEFRHPDPNRTVFLTE